MFGISLIVAIILGYLLKGRLSHLINLQIRGIWLILIGFLLERGLNLLLKIGWMELGIKTFMCYGNRLCNECNTYFCKWRSYASES